MSNNNDLLGWVTSDVDFYDLLGVTFENCTESELRRAYRKTALKYHPDKVGKDFDPAKYELFQAANDILSDPELKAKYDNHRNAKLQKQRANELFEGKRRQMKEDLEARERGGVATAGSKRPREDDAQQQELRKLAEEGRKRRAARASMMGESLRAQTSSPAPPPSEKNPAPSPKEQPEEDEVERLERKIREAEQAKARRKAEKKARKSGISVPADSPSVRGSSETGEKPEDRDKATPIKRPDTFRGLKADKNPSASPKFSFSPNTPKSNNFAATMERLKAAEKQRLEEEIRQRESEMA
jgi:DnaJ homolog subfamily C member 17